MGAYKRAAVSELGELVEGDKVLLLDCRRVGDYQNGHIENALHAHDGLVESLIKKGDKQQRIVIYCYTGHSSQHLAEFFGSFGFKDVYSVDGGYEAWEKQKASS